MMKRILWSIFILGLASLSIYSQTRKDDSSEAKTSCDRVTAIKQLPYGRESGVDAAYDALIQSGSKAIPCLIEKITDKTIMPDPRCPTISQATKVGDVAYFLLIEITNLNFVELLPAEVQQKYKTKGVYAYHEFIDRKGKRKQLQSKFREWYRQQQAAKS
jgi:hypothetical protein